MFFGLPLRTTKHDDGVGDHALVLVLVPVGVDEAGLDQAGDVGLERERHEVGGQAGLDGAALVARGAVGLLNSTSLPSGVAWKPG